MGALNQAHAERHPGHAELQARMQNYELAFRMQVQVPEVLDLSGEDAKTHEMYGIGDPATDAFGRKCLLARKLIEKGVRFVQLYHGSWDSHDYIERAHGNLVRGVDQPIAALIRDLRRRGLLEDTLVVWCGEFGRSPDNGVRGGTAYGRDHNPNAMTIWLAGGGVNAGHTIGATDELGMSAVEDVRHVRDFHVTLLRLLGLDDNKLTYYHAGRFKQLSQFGGKVIDRLKPPAWLIDRFRAPVADVVKTSDAPRVADVVKTSDDPHELFPRRETRSGCRQDFRRRHPQGSPPELFTSPATGSPRAPAHRVADVVKTSDASPPRVAELFTSPATGNPRAPAHPVADVVKTSDDPPATGSPSRPRRRDPRKRMSSRLPTASPSRVAPRTLHESGDGKPKSARAPRSGCRQDFRRRHPQGSPPELFTSPATGRPENARAPRSGCRQDFRRRHPQGSPPELFTSPATGNPRAPAHPVADVVKTSDGVTLKGRPPNSSRVRRRETQERPRTA